MMDTTLQQLCVAKIVGVVFIFLFSPQPSQIIVSMWRCIFLFCSAYFPPENTSINLMSAQRQCFICHNTHEYRKKKGKKNDNERSFAVC